MNETTNQNTVNVALRGFRHGMFVGVTGNTARLSSMINTLLASKAQQNSTENSEATKAS